MRAAFANTLAELAERDPRILLLSGDLGYMALEPFSERFPDRFINAGVAEQNMVGLATGLAESGFIPFVYSIVTFATLRPYEFIRNGPILHRLPVRIVGVGGGFEYGTAGPTHHGLEDVGVMRVQPGITVIAPADHQQARAAFLATWDLPGPIYYRIGKDDKTVVPGLDGRFELGRAYMVRHSKLTTMPLSEAKGQNHALERSEGSTLIITMGSVAAEAVVAAETLSEQGYECSVMVVASVNPAPISDLKEALSNHKLIIAHEAHYRVGGLGSLVSEVVAEYNIACRVVRCGVKETPHGISGSQAYMHKVNDISSDALVETVLGIYAEALR